MAPGGSTQQRGLEANKTSYRIGLHEATRKHHEGMVPSKVRSRQGASRAHCVTLAHPLRLDLRIAMALGLDDVRRVAQLARLRLDDAQTAAMLAELNAIFQLIGEMQAVDTSEVAPMSHALDMVQRLREDAVIETDQHALFQAVAPHVEGGLYLVPKVIE